VLPVDQSHGRVRTLGFRFGDFAYSTDVDGLSDDSFAALDGLDTWLLGCVRHGASFGHPSLETALSWIARVKPRRAVLTHMSADFDYRTLARALPPGVEPGYDGLVIDVPEPATAQATP